MKVTIYIPEEYEKDFKEDAFAESLSRVLIDCKDLNYEGVSGNYEYEIIYMLLDALSQGEIIDEGGK